MADLSLIKFYISSDLNNLELEEAKEMVKKKGGIIRDKVTNDLWYFVTNNSSIKNDEIQRAKDLGVILISEIELLKMLK